MQTYIVKAGDTLGTIAQKFLGSSSRWKEIWEANPSISNPDIINVGQTINIPGTSSTQATTTSSSQTITASRPAYEPIISETKNNYMDKIKLILQNKTVLYAGIGVISLLTILFIIKRK